MILWSKNFEINLIRFDISVFDFFYNNTLQKSHAIYEVWWQFVLSFRHGRVMLQHGRLMVILHKGSSHLFLVPIIDEIRTNNGFEMGKLKDVLIFAYAPCITLHTLCMHCGPSGFDITEYQEWLESLIRSVWRNKKSCFIMHKSHRLTTMTLH